MAALEKILNKVEIVKLIGTLEIEISNISFDSRKAIEKSLFIAVKGTSVDGHSYIDSVIEQGAIAIICEHLPERINSKITYIVVKDSSNALGWVASNYYNNPSQKLNVVGITGTNGKTTTATLLYRLFRNLGYKVGLFSTVKVLINDVEYPATHTTPDAIQLNSMFDLMNREGCTHVFMEVSSHAIVQNRIAGIQFKGAVFTNITHDHLDFHKTFEAYIKAKKLLFDCLPNTAFALSNIDDKNGIVMLQNTKASKVSYSLKTVADYKCNIIENQFSGLQLNIDGIDVWCKLVGDFNAYNLLAIYATALLLGEDKLNVLQELSNLSPVDGRFEYFRSKDNITAIVDYAHTPDALDNVISTINSIAINNEKLITVLGCGGNRDASKRPIMGKIAANHSYKAIFTSDNPRYEDPEVIIEQMISGVEKNKLANIISITNRKEAIKTAFALAVPGDIILIAGKGHEKYQEINGIKHPFDDVEIVNSLIK